MKLRNIILAALASVALFASCEKEPEVLPVDPDKTEKISVADFIAKADPQTVYTLSGVVENVAKGDRFWGFDLNDGTGVVTCAFPANWEEFKARIEDGGKITVKGAYQFYEQKGTHQVKKATILSYEAGTPLPPVEAEQISVKDFITKGKAGDKGIYRLVGTVSETAKGDRFWGFDLNDGTGVVTCAFPKNWNDFKDQIADGGTVTVQGSYQFYEQKGTDQVNKAVIISFVAGEVVPPAEAEQKTVAEFINLANTAKDFKLVGKVSEFKASYCSFTLTDETDNIVVWSVKNKSIWASLITDGGTVTLQGRYKWYENAEDASKNKHEVVDATILSFVDAQGNAVVPDTTPSTEDFNSKIAWTLGTGSYDATSAFGGESAKFNGQAEAVSILKFGSKKNGGEATLTIPSGTKEIAFYAFAWAGDSEVKAIFDVNGTATEIPVVSNAGFSGNEKPYTITVKESDRYTLNVEGATTVKVSSPAGQKRFALAAVVASK